MTTNGLMSAFESAAYADCRTCKLRRASQAFLIEHDEDTVDFVGNRTDCALLMLLRSWGASYEDMREVRSRHRAVLLLRGHRLCVVACN